MATVCMTKRKIKLNIFFAWRVFKRSNTKPFEAIAGNLKVRPLEPDPQIETKGPDKA